MVAAAAFACESTLDLEDDTAESPDLGTLKRALSQMRVRFRRRFLRQSSKWCGQMLLALEHVPIKPAVRDSRGDGEGSDTKIEEDERDVIDLAYDYLQCGETDRAAHCAENCRSSLGVFLHLYSRYLSSERRHIESSPDPLTSAASSSSSTTAGAAGTSGTGGAGCLAAGGGGATASSRHCAELCQLRAELERRPIEGKPPDAFLDYLHGVVLARLALREPAVEALCAAVRREPLLWPGWQELASLVTDREHLERLDVTASRHWTGDVCVARWMRSLFTAHAYLELQMNDEAMSIYERMETAGLHRSTYVQVQKAIGFQNLRRVDEAIELFERLAMCDPCRLEHMDAYSNLLFVKGLPVALCALAHRLTAINKYGVETCCVVGNYYSLKNQHEKAIVYFQRALKVCPGYLAAWTLMGHEYLELKNTNAAIQCYRRAVQLNERDYRAWYGLGQTYEILKMPLYCQYYYQRAHRLRPNDSRMLMAMGESYEKLERLHEAKRCYWKAHSIGDIEGVALLRLARLFERLGEVNRAAAAYSDYLREADIEQQQQQQPPDGWSGGEECALAHRFLANFLMARGQLDAAQMHAARCAQFVETREEARAIQRELAQRRSDEATTAAGQSTTHVDHDEAPTSTSCLGRLSLRSNLQRSYGDQQTATAQTPTGTTPQYGRRNTFSALRRFSGGAGGGMVMTSGPGAGGRLSLPFSPLDFGEALHEVVEEPATAAQQSEEPMSSADMTFSPSESSQLL